MTNLTALEFAFLNNVAHSQYSNVNGTKPETLDDVGSVWFWADEMASALGISGKAVGGVITSLQEKGLIDIFIASAKDKRNGDDSSVSMTEAGFSAWEKETSVNEQKAKPAPKAKAKAKPAPTTKLTALEIAAIKLCLNYRDSREAQLSDNYSNGGHAEFMASLNLNRKAASALIGSLEKKGMGWSDDGSDCDSTINIFWLSEKAVNLIFDIMEKETSVNEQKAKPAPAPKAKAKAKAKPANLKEAPKSAIANREAWLKKVGTAMVPHIEGFAEKSTGRKIKFKEWRVSCGWPSKGGLPGNKRRVRGQCWDSSVSGDSNCEIYISPVEAEAKEVADILAHELIHALLGTAIGHKAPFPQIAKAMGLDGKPTATFAGEAFWAWAQPIIDKAGPYPHAALSPRAQGKVAKTYLIKAQAPCCGSVLRLTQKVIDNSGMPLCGCSGEAISYEEA